jgi:gas vesicle protein
MYSVKKVVKAMNKQKRKEQARNLALASTIGAASGAVMALFIAPKSDRINNSLNQIKEKVVEVVEIGKEKVDKLVNEGRNMLEERKNDIKEVKGKLEDKFEDAKNDIVEGVDDNKNTIEDLKG